MTTASNLTAAQVEKLQQLTQRFSYRNQFSFIDGAVRARIEPLDGDSIMLCLGNDAEDGGPLRWFEKYVSAIVIVGPRGGIKRKSGDAALTRYI